MEENTIRQTDETVSYTHLDVYKRQGWRNRGCMRASEGKSTHSF